MSRLILVFASKKVRISPTFVFVRGNLIPIGGRLVMKSAEKFFKGTAAASIDRGVTMSWGYCGRSMIGKGENNAESEGGDL
ncbi:MAG: hypothetical protein ACM3UW_03070 [Bacillota bacterium]